MLGKGTIFHPEYPRCFLCKIPIQPQDTRTLQSLPKNLDKQVLEKNPEKQPWFKITSCYLQDHHSHESRSRSSPLPLLRKGQGAQLAFLGKVKLKHPCVCKAQAPLPMTVPSRDTRGTTGGSSMEKQHWAKKDQVCAQSGFRPALAQHKHGVVVLGKRREHPHNSPHHHPSHALTLYI